MILRILTVGPFSANCYIVGAEKEGCGMVIDPGDEAEKILGNVKSLGLNIQFIVLTHGHIDHVGALKEVKEATGALIAAHTDEVTLIKENPMNRLFGLSYPTPPLPDRLLSDGDVIEVASLSFSVLHTPGHSPGGICLLGEGVLFSGDTLFRSGIGRFDLPGGSYEILANSLKRLLKLPDGTIVYPGHGPDTTIGREKSENPFLSN